MSDKALASPNVCCRFTAPFEFMALAVGFRRPVVKLDRSRPQAGLQVVLACVGVIRSTPAACVHLK
jgi:hypothetical protein